jgi:TPR repeat protein
MAMKEGTLGIRRLDEGAHWASVACERGHLPSCNELGYMLVNGEGIEKNQTAGAALFYSACERGFAVACDSMGEAIENGWGFPADAVKAREFYNHACSLGNEYSCKRADPAPTSTELGERQ